MKTPSEDPTKIELSLISPHQNPGVRSLSDHLRSMTRLCIGGVVVGVEGLLRQLEEWEQEIEVDQVQLSQASKTVPPEISDAVNGQLDAVEQEKRANLLRFAVIGLIIDTQDRFISGIEQSSRLPKIIHRWVSPWFRPFQRIWPGRYIRVSSRQFEQLVNRGQQEVERWIQLGKQEDAHSRQLIEAAYTDTVDGYIDYLTANPEVQELVQSQSTGLANEVVEEVRERTVSADTFLEALIRSLTRRTPRAYLPEPPGELRQGAASPYMTKKKSRS